MKRISSSILLVILILTSSIFASSAFATPDEKIPVIVGFKGLPDAALIHAHGGQISYEYTIIHAIACSLPAQAVSALQNNPNIAYVEEDFAVTALEYKVGSEDWGITQIGANTVHTTNKGTGVKVAVIDTGINKLHEDLQSNYNGGYNFLNPGSEPIDDNGHGTHCAGIIAAAINQIAVVGVAPEASIYAYKVLNSQGSGTVSNIIAAINRAVADGVQVISMSLGSSSYSQGLHDACYAATQSKVVVVAAAGNSGNTPAGSTVNYPAKFDDCVIAVGATDVNDKLATFSSTGPEVDVVAPGVNILSDYRDVTPNDGMNRDTLYMSGTSMACPHVAGTAALILHVDSSLTPSQVQGILQATAIDKGNVGFDNYYGYGRVDAAQAVATAADKTPPAQVTGLTPSATSDTQISLTWTPLNAETDLKGYNVYRSSDQTQFSLIKFVIAPANSYIDSGLAASTTYYYKVAAVDKAGNEGHASDVAPATTLSKPLSQPLFSSIAMSLKTSLFNTYATATINIVDAAGKAVSGATVSGKWSGATSDSDTGTTGTNGAVTVQSNNVRSAKSGTTFTFTITAVTKTGYTLDPTKSEMSDSVTK